MVAMKGHFDGKFIVPDEPVELPIDEPLIVRVERANGASPLRGMAGAALLRFAGTIEPPELEQMSSAIEQGCGQVDRNEW